MLPHRPTCGARAPHQAIPLSPPVERLSARRARTNMTSPAIPHDIVGHRQRCGRTSPAISPKSICDIAASLNLPYNQGSDDTGDIACDIVRCRRTSLAMSWTSPAKDIVGDIVRWRLTSLAMATTSLAILLRRCAISPTSPGDVQDIASDIARCR